VIAPLGVEASLRALEELSAGGAAQRAALSRKLEQLVYEAKKAFEQYDAVDARNRLAASELERRWNEKLEEIEAVKQRLSSLDAQRYSLSPEEETRIRSMGDHFAGAWQSKHCPPTLKKMIFRTAIEEIMVCIRNWRWSGRAPQRKPPRLWKRWRSFVVWLFATATTRLPLC
jgi:1,2-phenylacetyl-CoA epoxidase catalytic subunit